jgi:hypothetical protein
LQERRNIGVEDEILRFAQWSELQVVHTKRASSCRPPTLTALHIWTADKAGLELFLYTELAICTTQYDKGGSWVLLSFSVWSVFS